MHCSDSNTHLQHRAGITLQADYQEEQVLSRALITPVVVSWGVQQSPLQPQFLIFHPRCLLHFSSQLSNAEPLEPEPFCAWRGPQQPPEGLTPNICPGHGMCGNSPSGCLFLPYEIILDSTEYQALARSSSKTSVRVALCSGICPSPTPQLCGTAQAESMVYEASEHAVRPVVHCIPSCFLSTQAASRHLL